MVTVSAIILMFLFASRLEATASTLLLRRLERIERLDLLRNADLPASKGVS